MIYLGIEQLLSSPPQWLSGCRLGLLCNQASTDSKLRHSRDLINKTFPAQLTCLFSPQHGFFSEKQDNMVESQHLQDDQGRHQNHQRASEKRFRQESLYQRKGIHRSLFVRAQDIALPSDCLKIPRGAGIGFDLPPKPRDLNIDRPLAAIDIAKLRQGLAAHDPAGLFG